MGQSGDLRTVDAVSIPAAIVLVALAYFLGAVPFAFLLGKSRGVDIRTVGSGNIGATNLTRALGHRWGVAAFLLDFLKGLLPVVLVAGWARAFPSARGLLVPYTQIICALAAIVGHVLPVYLRFRGGKGVATSFGALTGLSWAAALAAGAVWLGIFLLTRTVSLASIGAALAFPVGTAVAFWAQPPAVAIPMDLLAALVGALIVFRHRSNIQRLLVGREDRF